MGAEQLQMARTLAPGACGQQVCVLQRHLHIRVDGRYRASTTAAVQRFQRFEGLPETGEADVDTQALLLVRRGVVLGLHPTAEAELKAIGRRRAPLRSRDLQGDALLRFLGRVRTSAGMTLQAASPQA